MAINFNLLDHLKLIRHLGRCFKHNTDETSPGLVKIGICAKEGDPNPCPFQGKAGEARRRTPFCRNQPGCHQDGYLPAGTRQHVLPLAQGGPCEKNGRRGGYKPQGNQVSLLPCLTEQLQSCFRFFISQRLCALSRTSCHKVIWSLGGFQHKILLYKGRTAERMPESFREGNEALKGKQTV